MSKALIIGVDSQDGSYLSELLLARDYQVVGWVPASILPNLENIRTIVDHITLVKGHLSDDQSILDCLEEHQPDEIYNLAAPSSPNASWNNPTMVGDIAGLGVARLLQAILKVCPKAHFYQASSSEIFGDPIQSPQDEATSFFPRNPYGIAKLYAHWMTVRYRQQFGLFAVSGILYNHESPRRGPDFVTRKITRHAAQIKLGLAKKLSLGDLEARRDWGYAGDYVEAMWRMLQQESPEDFVIGTGCTHSVRDFCELAFACLDLDYRDYVVEDPDFVRAPETVQLIANIQKARQKLDWEPRKSFDDLVRMMVMADLKRLQEESPNASLK